MPGRLRLNLRTVCSMPLEMGFKGIYRRVLQTLDLGQYVGASQMSVGNQDSPMIYECLGQYLRQQHQGRSFPTGNGGMPLAYATRERIHHSLSTASWAQTYLTTPRSNCANTPSTPVPGASSSSAPLPPSRLLLRGPLLPPLFALASASSFSSSKTFCAR